MDERDHKAMNKKFKGYWVICQQSYEVDGIYIPKGRMDFHESPIPIQNEDWRRATQEEINTKKYHKGNFFNLPNVSITEISKKQTTLKLLIEAIQKREVEVTFNTINGIVISNIDKYIQMEMDQLIEAHSEGIRFMAINTDVPQPVSIIWFSRKYDKDSNKEQSQPSQ